MMKKTLLLLSLTTCLLLASCGPKASGSASTAEPSNSNSSASTSMPDSSGSSSTPDPSASGSSSDTTNSGGTTTPSGSSSSSQPQTNKRDQIPFTDGQSYAVAHLGYLEIEDLDYYVQRYLDSDDVPIHSLSSGDYYLIIPRYEGMELSLYANDFNTSESSLFYQEADCQPFILQCNVSDIFPDATIELTYQGETVSFSPFISLKDGSLDIGEHGLDLTKPTSNNAASE